jgi:hypothetical protein
MRSGRNVMNWLIVGSLAAGAVGAALAIAGARTPLVLLFLALAPAFAVLTWLDGLDRLARVVVAVTGAVVVNFAVAEAMIMTGGWSPRAGVAAVALVSVIIAAPRLARRVKGQNKLPGQAEPAVQRPR